MSFKIHKAYSDKAERRNKQKSQLSRGGKPEGGALMPYLDNQTQQEDSFLPGKVSANEMPRTCLLTTFFPTSFSSR